MVKRVCQVIKLKPDRFDDYCKLHDEAWPGVLLALHAAHFTNYSIFHYPEMSMLVGYWEWTGEDWEADMESVAKDEETRRWWKLTDGMQDTLVEGATGSGGEKGWWLDLKEVFHFSGQLPPSAVV